jgi:hypothetical protein
MPLYTIFWGPYWATPDGQAQQAALENSLNTMFYFNPTLSGLNQYGVHFPAGVSGSGTVEVNDFSDPVDGFSKSRLDDVVTNAIDNLDLPEEDDFSNGGFYLVFTPPNISAGEPAAAFHTSTFDFDFPFDFDTWHYAWIGNFNSMDYITNSISHEVMEAMTDPNDDGIRLTNGNEIADGEALNYAALVAGHEVASFWSARDNAYAVYDGNSQVVTFDNGNVIVNGDQFGPNTDDTITVDLNSEGQPQITLNGQTFSFTSDPVINHVTAITINPGGGANTINVLRTSSSAPVSINGVSRDTVNIGVGGSVQGIHGNVTIENPPSFTAINVDDSADPAPQVATLSTFTPPGDSNWGSIVGLAPATISYEYADTSSLTLRSGSGSIVNVAATGVSTSLVGNGPTTVNLGDYLGVQDILGSLTITNPPSFTTLTVDDSADPIGRTATLDTFTDASGSTFGRITGLAPASISYKQADTSSPVTIDGGAGADTFTVASLPFQAVDLNTGAGNDTVVLQTASGGLVVDGQGGTNTLVGPSASVTWIIAGDNAGNIAGVATFTGVEDLTGGSANDTFKLSNGKGVVGVINGGGGVNTLDYSSYTTGVTVNLTTGAATGTGGVTNIQNVTGSPANDRITGSSASNVLNGDGGSDLLNGGSGGADSFILAATQGTATTITGGGTADTLRAANIANTWTITGANSGNVNGIAFTGIARLVGGTSSDAFKFTTGSVTGTVDGGGGTDALDYSADGGTAATVNLATLTATRTGGFANIEKLVGSTFAADTLVGPNATRVWSITAANAGTVGAFSFSGVENLIGGAGIDEFVFAACKTVSGKIDGGTGADNWLDYASYTTGVRVDLTANSATGVDGGVTGGIANIRNVRGGLGSDTLKGNSKGNILIGGPSTDTIIGGGGGSILIGGKGGDAVTGRSADDIVIGGVTNFDNSSDANDQALEAILAEWQSADIYTTRIAKIKAGVGPAHATFVLGTTVHDDGNISTLIGGLGTDWFFKGAHDTITDLASGEQVN